MKNFEDFLQDQHGKQYVGTDDMMPEDYEEWLVGLDVDEWIDMGEGFKKELVRRIEKELPEKRGPWATYSSQGYNQCLDEIKQLLTK